jgi:hypothetical protein
VAWLEDTVKQCCTIANYIQDSEQAKALLNMHQLDVYQKKKVVPVNVPTRFATPFLVTKGIQGSKAAFLQAAASDGWSELEGKCEEV